MGSLLAVVAPLFAFMLIPVWIPMIAVSAGALLDLVRPARTSTVTAAVNDVKARSAATRSATTRTMTPAPAGRRIAVDRATGREQVAA